MLPKTDLIKDYIEEHEVTPSVDVLNSSKNYQKRSDNTSHRIDNYLKEETYADFSRKFDEAINGLSSALDT